jgi:hypothetical protein
MRSTVPSLQQKELLDELAILSREQADALEHATYFRMTPEEANRYDQRAGRMNKICSMLNQLKAT